ncbi:MAG: hypothetical protein ACOH2I_02635 [Pseudomonas sp.]
MILVVLIVFAGSDLAGIGAFAGHMGGSESQKLQTSTDATLPCSTLLRTGAVRLLRQSYQIEYRQRLQSGNATAQFSLRMKA